MTPTDTQYEPGTFPHTHVPDGAAEEHHGGLTLERQAPQTALDTAEPAAPAKPLVKAGDAVVVTIQSAGTVRAALATVLSVGSRMPNAPVGENGEPLLTVAYIDSTDSKTLTSASWFNAFKRVGPVHHESSPAAEAGVTYGAIIPMDVSGGIDVPAVTLPDVAAAAAAEIQRKQAMGVGQGPVADKDIAFQTATASGVAEKTALKGSALTERPIPTGEKENVIAHTPTREWPPRTAKLGVAMQPGEKVPQSAAASATGAKPVPQVDPEAEKAAAASPSMHSRAQGIMASLKPADSTSEAKA